MGEKVYELDKNPGGLQSRFEKEYHSDFSFRTTSLALGMRKAVLLKFALIKPWLWVCLCPGPLCTV